MNSENKILPYLPIQSQSFEEIRTNNGLYVDKSEFAYKLLHTPFLKNCFIGRPRRFGKSLFLSTLESYAQGRKDLFVGLKAEKLEKEWRKYEVLKFDFSGGVTRKDFLDLLSIQLSQYEIKYFGDVRESLSPGVRFSTLIQKAANGIYGSVVILIDEYDAPLTSNLYTNVDEEREREKIIEIYRNMFPCVKTYGHLIKLFFLTGVMKFMGLHIFSTLNNVKILTTDNEYGSLFGFTHEELRGPLLPYVEELAKSVGICVEEAFGELVGMYDSYCFCGDLSQRVFNPYSLINCLSDKVLKSYWSVSGLTKQVFDCIKSGKYVVPDFESLFLSKRALEETDSDPKNLTKTLYQSGYLTIDYLEKENSRYKLRVPNREVKESLVNTIIPLLMESGGDEDSTDEATFIFRRLLNEGKISEALDKLKALIAATPYSNEKMGLVVEDRFQTIVSLVFFFCGYKTRREVTASGGDIDIVAENEKNVFVIETKVSSKGGVKKAMAQIKNRGYAEMYKADKRKVYAIGMCFDKKKRIMREYEIWNVK